jgi:hypothetical protein
MVFRTSAQIKARTVGVCALTVIAGCFPLDPSGDPSWPEEVLSAAPPPPPPAAGEDPAGTSSPPPIAPSQPQVTTRHVETEPNNTWHDANIVSFGGSVEIVGTIASSTGVKDVDLFDLGPAYAGQRLQADLNVSGGADVQMGLLDAQGRILAYVDPMSPTAGPDYVDISLHESTDRLYVMIATRSSSTTVRSYTANVSLEWGTAPWPRPQVIVLTFGGADQVRIGFRPPVDVPPFDIATINPEFAGQTEAAIARLLERVREDYAGLGVQFYRDGDPAIPAGNHTFIYFGSTDTRLLGLAESIDPYNNNPAQSAIIYTDTFSLFNQLQPGFEGTVRVLANVTSHEAGHLLGLRHTADPEDLMDVTATARQMLMDQWFKNSPLHASVLPAGLQDSPTMLSWTLGGSLRPPTSFKLYARSKAIPPGAPELDFYIPRSMLADCGCVECLDTQPETGAD